MKVLKETQYEYLKIKAHFHEFIGILLSVITFVFCYSAFAYFYLLICLSLVSGYGSFEAFKRSMNYRKGIYGEKRVSKTLKELDSSYYLLEDVKISKYGNIDHIVLGPNGIFVIETKNWGGRVNCYRDDWYIGSKKIKSVSKQVKGNALDLTKFITSHIGSIGSIYVVPIVVFTNPLCDIKFNDPTVVILRLNGLCGYIKNQRRYPNLSDDELKMIGDAILKQDIELVCMVEED